MFTNPVEYRQSVNKIKSHELFHNETFQISKPELTIGEIEKILQLSPDFISLNANGNDSKTYAYCHNEISYQYADYSIFFEDPNDQNRFIDILSPVIPVGLTVQFKCPDHKQLHTGDSANFTYYCVDTENGPVYDFGATLKSYLKNCDLCYDSFKHINEAKDAHYGPKWLNIAKIVLLVSYGISFTFLLIAMTEFVKKSFSRMSYSRIALYLDFQSIHKKRIFALVFIRISTYGTTIIIKIKLKNADTNFLSSARQLRMNKAPKT